MWKSFSLWASLCARDYVMLKRDKPSPTFSLNVRQTLLSEISLYDAQHRKTVHIKGIQICVDNVVNILMDI